MRAKLNDVSGTVKNIRAFAVQRLLRIPIRDLVTPAA